MAYICNNNQPCSGCKHYRYDDDYGSKACFAEQDAMTASSVENKQTPKTQHHERTE